MHATGPDMAHRLCRNFKFMRLFFMLKQKQLAKSIGLVLAGAALSAASVSSEVTPFPYSAILHTSYML
ncbi:MAG TPA: hypothetical protein DCZ48_10780 [Methylococcaceae bacterium]|nr:hypothetical protein [Methylococcaceae bacterium]